MSVEAVGIVDQHGRPARGGSSAASADRRRMVQRKVMSVAGDVLRERMTQLAGLQYDDKRDVYKVAGYPAEYTFEEGWSRYRRQGIARRLVDLPVQRTWRKRPEMSVEGEGEEGEFVEGWNTLWDDLGLSRVFERADRLASIGEYSVIYLGLAGVSSDQELARPVEPGDVDGPEDVLFARAIKQSDADIGGLVSDHESPNHGMPESYNLRLAVDVESAESLSGEGEKVEVHHSRVIHVVEDPLDNDVEGLPRLERAINRLIDLEKLPAATAEAFWQLAVQILSISVDPRAELDDSDWENLGDEFDEIVHDLKRHFLGTGITMEFVGGEEPDPTGAADLLLTMLTASYGIPKRVFLGTETGERASEQDERAFLGLVGDRIQQYADPTIVRGFTDRMINVGALPEPSGRYELSWPPLRELDELEEAEIDQTRAETADTLTPVGGDPKRLVEITEEGRVRLRPDVELEEIEEDGAGGNGASPPGLEGEEDEIGEPVGAGEGAA